MANSDSTPLRGDVTRETSPAPVRPPSLSTASTPKANSSASQMSKPRWIALILLLLAAPIQLMTMPWFVLTIYEFQDLISELSRDGSSAYIEGRTNRLQRNIFTLSLYVLNAIAMTGLFGIAINIFRRKIILLPIWLIVILLAFGYFIFIPPTEGDFSKNAFVAVFIFLPISLALIGAYASCRSRE